jgi:hypothetical protein
VGRRCSADRDCGKGTECDRSNSKCKPRIRCALLKTPLWHCFPYVYLARYPRKKRWLVRLARRNRKYLRRFLKREHRRMLRRGCRRDKLRRRLTYKATIRLAKAMAGVAKVKSNADLRRACPAFARAAAWAFR